MANWNGLQMTNKGIALQAKVEAGVTLTITKLKIGSGVLPSGTDIKTLTDLISPEQNLSIGAKEPNGDYCKISSTISNVGLTAGYYVRELGVFAQDPDEGEILYMYTTDGAPDYLPAEGGSTVISQEFSVNIAVSDATEIEVTIDPGALATMGYVQLQIQEHNTDENAHANITGATSNAAGKRGMVPAPPTGKQNSLLAGDGTWRDLASLAEVLAGTDNTKPITPLCLKEALESLVEGIHVGDVVYRPFLAAGYVKANGATVNRADYPNLVAFANAHSLWTASPSNEPWKYGIGNGSTTMVLPDYRGRVIQGGDNCTVLTAGLPNIYGNIYHVAHGQSLGGAADGMFAHAYETNTGNASSGGELNTFSLSASRVNPIYGNSDTVQPPAVILIPQIKY